MNQPTDAKVRCEHCGSENLAPLQVEPGDRTESGALITNKAPEGPERQYRCTDCHRITVVNNQH
jgi:DNA-directed RNA polymerase subunit RPC12/RpoP